MNYLLVAYASAVVMLGGYAVGLAVRWHRLRATLRDVEQVQAAD